MTNQELTDFTCNGECSKCGSCCSNYLPLTRKEFRVLKHWVRKHRFQPKLVTDVLDVTCPFLDKETSLCVCYKVRPEVCRIFTCRKAIANQVKFSKSRFHFRVYNLRQELFGDTKSLGFAEFQLLMDYIRKKTPEEDS